MTERGQKRRMRGVVTSVKTAKTITVKVSRQFPHPKYGKRVRRDTKIHAHDERQEAHVGDAVEIVECRPYSKTKHWRLVRVIRVDAAPMTSAEADVTPESASAE